MGREEGSLGPWLAAPAFQWAEEEGASVREVAGKESVAINNIRCYRHRKSWRPRKGLGCSSSRILGAWGGDPRALCEVGQVSKKRWLNRYRKSDGLLGVRSHGDNT